MRRLLLLTALTILLPLRLAASPAAQATLKGRVLDPSRAPIVAARVTATPDDPSAAVSAITDDRGEFTLALLPGSYTIAVVADGFEPTSERVTVQPGVVAIPEFVVQIAGFQDAVTVSAPGSYEVDEISSATKTLTPLQDVPQSVTVVTKTLMKDQLMTSIGDVMRYVPGIQVHQGENNRDQVIIRGNSSSADFFVNGVRDDVQYYRDLYNLDRVEALKGPNAMIFGRGGGGGVVNQVTKEAGFRPIREVMVQGGEYGNRRVTGDLDQPVSKNVAFRLNGMYEDSDSFRDFVNLERYGINPTVTVSPGSQTRVAVAYEYLHDRRVADRGITSYQGRPAAVPISTYYGNPDDSHVRADVNLTTATVEHRAGAATIRNRTLFGDYDRGYQNFVPGAASADGAQVTLTAYNNATQRQNLFNQTDLIYVASTGQLRHTLLAGAELSHQLTDNFRNTGYFNNLTTSILVPFGAPTISTPVTFRQSLTDADNHVTTNVAAGYAQDQVELSRNVQVVAGVRFDHFDQEYHNNRNGDTLDRTDNLVSPRAGLIYKPIAPVSVYGSYSVSYLPSAGDQFGALTVISEQLEPEKFTNYEVGVKWEVRPELSVTTAVYRLNRTNTRSTDPNDPTRIVQTGSQRTNGFEVGVNGQVTQAWSIAGGYAYQDAFVTSATAAAIQGAKVAQVPNNTFSLWNAYRFLPRLTGAVGIVSRADMFAAIDDTVVLPAFARVDAAAYYSLTKDVRLQANVENLFNKTYYTNADSNTNISPGFPRAIRVALVAGF